MHYEQNTFSEKDFSTLTDSTQWGADFGAGPRRRAAEKPWRRWLRSRKGREQCRLAVAILLLALSAIVAFT